MGATVGSTWAQLVSTGDLFYTYLGLLTLGLKKHKLESRLQEEISKPSDMQMTPPSWQKVKN